jgi:fructose 1,6-bisphosphate aldolase/phosphatase
MAQEMKLTLSVIKADVGSVAGHNRPHPDLLKQAEECLAAAKAKRLLIDYHVTRCGDDINLIMTHFHGVSHEPIHRLAWDTFMECTRVAKSLKLYGAGQDLLVDAFSGNVKGMGPGVAEMEFIERPSEPVVILMADKTSPGAWNLPLYKIFADAFNTPGLVIDPKMHEGFTFSVLDVKKKAVITLACPEEQYDLLMFLGAHGRYMVKEIRRKVDNEIAAVASTDVLSEIAGKYVGKDDPVCIIRAQAGMPAVGEILEPFAFPHLVEGWMRGSHQGPLMPVAFHQANPTRFDGPPRVIAAGFQLNQGALIGPIDLFDDPAFDEARRQANVAADYMRRHGPFEPHRLPLEEMEYTTMPMIMSRLRDRFKSVG